MKKIILMMILFLLSFSYGFSKPSYSKGKLYIKQSIIEETTSIVDFVIENLEISFPGNSEEAYFEPEQIGKNQFITMGDIKVSSGTHLVEGNRVYYKRIDGKNMENKDPIIITITGKLIFNWRIPENYLINLGGISFKSDNKKTEDVIINFGEYIKDKIISKIQLQVVRDLHLGFGVAGEIFDSEAGKGQSVNAHPAEISIKCDSKSRNYDKPEIELSIPRTVTIKNENGTPKEVYLRFGENLSRAINKEKKYENDEIELEIIPVEENITVFINGNMKTSEKDEDGVYTGTFVLRAEYDKD